MGDQIARTVPARISDTLDHWTSQARALRIVHIFLVVIATCSSVLAATGLGKTLAPYIGLPPAVDPLAALAAIAIALVSTFELSAKSNNFRNGWRLLHAAIMRYEEEPDYSVEKLIEAYEQAEKLIGDVKATPRSG